MSTSNIFQIKHSAPNLFNPNGSIDRRRFLVDVFEQQHVSNFWGSAIVKSCFSGKFLRIMESSKNDVEKWEVRIVMRMNTLCVVHWMWFRSLENISHPLRSFDVGVLNDSEKCCGINGIYRCLSGKSCDPNHGQTGQKSKSQHIHWTKKEGTVCIHSFCTVMHLVKYAPQQLATNDDA